MQRDLIRVSDLELRSPSLERDLWQRANKQQPLVCSLEIRTSVQTEADADNLHTDSLNYGTVTKAVEKHVASLSSPSDEGLPLEVLAEQLCRVVLFGASAPNVRLELRRPRALLTAESVGVVLSRSRADYTLAPTPPTGSSGQPKSSEYTLRTDSPALKADTLFVRALRRQIIIGLNACERLDEQEVIVDLEFGADDMNTRLASGARAGWAGWRKTVKQIEQHLSTSGPLTIEHIVTSLSSLILTPPSTPLSATTPATPGWDVPRTTVRVSKPSALMFARHPSVQVTRTRADFPALFSLVAPARGFSTSSAAADNLHIAYLGLGTNLGERAGNLNDAVSKLEEVSQGAVKVVDTSFMYESEAMYHEDQAKFLNAAVKVETTLSPAELLQACKAVEESLGRDFSTFRNGPRVIDLDVLLYDQLVFDTREAEGSAQKDKERWLKVPHQGIAEREFVLRPLADLAPTLTHPVLRQTPLELLRTVLATSPSTVHRVYPLSRSIVHPFSRASAPATSTRTTIMSILNVTPDSFSDGGDHSTLERALAAAKLHLAHGADILDVGGMSTRPGAANISPDAEAERVVPVISALRADSASPAAREVPISIDTFRPSVARAAVAAGATLVNDVYGGREHGMLDAMADLACPVVLMHSRGDPSTMTRLTDYSAHGGVVGGMRAELEQSVEAALGKGVRRWNILLDPGIGFAKTAQQNFALLRALPAIFGPASDSPLREFPVLVGLSRKRFLAPEKDDAKDRIAETSAATAACVASGVCEVVRVHDTKEMRDVVRVADAIYRGKGE
ncbi:trifunctional dihydropteroate synthetase/dihydrohydroxymethylpterin pyrophosphokinase/dihydroneopterin aldolase FOL1 [Rhodotorula paludigena]|uniref:trifunctional dihydropteroate synthetase/dihydrohydroxymethylpterin pyrophosphokinase/dihydroneopterin aldolase FOL1 n=1 Tax=Rhodotorula paludigena TaxID=86838 RepID=UPI00316BCDA3